MKKPIRFLLFIVFLYLPFQSMAWGPLGHRIIGQIAESYLTARARKNIKRILANESIAMASNWGDFIKSDPAYSYLNTWHYIDIPDGMDRDKLQTYLRNDTAADVYTKLNFLISALKQKNLTKQKELLYLRMLIHLAGDIHQPLHVREKDMGGNRTRVQWFNAPTNLHRLWDEQLIDFQKLSYTEYAASINFPSKKQKTLWQHQPVSEWIYDSYRIGEPIFKEISRENKSLGYRYNFDHIDTINLQLLKGGIRLAGLLNEIFG